jgi:hypothetical protein
MEDSMASMTIYDSNGVSENFDGASDDLTREEKGAFGEGGEWNDTISSIDVHSGVWRLFEHIHYQGEHRDYGPGRHRDGFLPKVSSFSIVQQ